MLDDFYQAELNDDPTVKVDVGADGDYYIAKYSKNKDFQAALTKAQKIYKRQLNKADPEGKFNQKVMAPLIAKHILTGWKLTISKATKDRFFSDLHVNEVEGKPGVYSIPFNVENATAVLSKFEFQPFLNDIFATSVTRSNFADEDLEDDIKN